ncbi:MAG TPA: GrpB family protein [Rubrobacter sp.]
MTFPTVILAEYDPGWPALFEAEKERIMDAIGPQALAIEHVGSTAIPGMPAKPVIDVMAGTRNVAETADACTAPLQNIGYEYIPKPALLDRRFFRRGAWLLECMYHLHMVELGGDTWYRYTLFRDALRADPDVARGYQELKQQLAAEYRFDRATYTAAKNSFVEGVVDEARNRLGL